jgi:hypothetical protein
VSREIKPPSLGAVPSRWDAYATTWLRGVKTRLDALQAAAVADPARIEAVINAAIAKALKSLPAPTLSTDQVLAALDGAVSEDQLTEELVEKLGIEDGDTESVQTSVEDIQDLLDGNLTAFAALVATGDQVPYFTGPAALALAALTSFARSLLDDGDALTARATLGLVIGTNVEAWDADLDAIAALTGTGWLQRTGEASWSLGVPVSTVTLLASGAISGHRVVVADATGVAAYADATNPAHSGRVVGITLGAAADGDPVTVAVGGDIEEPSWTWSAGPLYLGTAGGLTQSAPTSGFVQVLGVALSPTRIVVEPSQPINLV